MMQVIPKWGYVCAVNRRNCEQEKLGRKGVGGHCVLVSQNSAEACLGDKPNIRVEEGKQSKEKDHTSKTHTHIQMALILWAV